MDMRICKHVITSTVFFSHSVHDPQRQLAFGKRHVRRGNEERADVAVRTT